MNYKLELALRDRSSYVNIFDTFDLLDNEDIVLPQYYIPQMFEADEKTRATSPKNCFIRTTNKIITSSESTIVSFIQLNSDGSIEDDTVLDIEQFVPNGFLVRLTCPQRNLSADAVQVDYIVDMNKIYLDQSTVPNDTKRHVRFRRMEIRSGIYTDGERKVKISDEIITDFNNPKSREWLLRKYIIRK